MFLLALLLAIPLVSAVPMMGQRMMETKETKNIEKRELAEPKQMMPERVDVPGKDMMEDKGRMMASPGNMMGRSMNVSLADIRCKIDFTNALINAIDSHDQNASLGNYSSKLSSDLVQLQTYAANSDVSGYREYLHQTYEPDFRAAKEAMRDWRHERLRNDTSRNDTRELLKSEDLRLRKNYESCNFGMLKSMAVNRADNALIPYENRVANLKSKGTNTSKMETLLSDAKSQILLPLQVAISSANDSKSLKNAFESYCFFDDCKNGTNFHLASKFDVAMLSSVLDQIRANPASGNYSSQIASAQASLDSANSVIASAGTSQLSQSQKREIAQDLNTASKTIKDMIYSARKAPQRGRMHEN